MPVNFYTQSKLLLIANIHNTHIPPLHDYDMSLHDYDMLMCVSVYVCMRVLWYVATQAKIKVLSEGISSLASVEEPLSKCKSRLEVAEGLVLKQVRHRMSSNIIEYAGFSLMHA